MTRWHLAGCRRVIVQSGSSVGAGHDEYVPGEDLLREGLLVVDGEVADLQDLVGVSSHAQHQAASFMSSGRGRTGRLGAADPLLSTSP
jgi:hypothetical protein